MIAQPTAVLFLSEDGDKLQRALNPDAYSVITMADLGKAMELLHDANHDMIVLDAVLFEQDLLQTVRELRRRFPLKPLLVLCDSGDNAYQTDLMEAGATDLLRGDLPNEELHRRLRLVLQQQRQHRALARRNTNLQSLTTLARRLHTVTTTQMLVAETIKHTCKTFGLYGMAIIMMDGEMLTIHAGDQETTEANLHTSSINAPLYHPFRRVIDSGLVQMFGSIRTDSYYTTMPALPDVESAIIVPLSSPDYIYGALAVFGSHNQPLDTDDLIIYELFATQFTTALQNARLYEEQERRVQTISHLLRAWQRFITLDTAEDIARNLREMVEDIPGVSSCVVWLYTDDMGEDAVINALQADIVRTFRELHSSGFTNKIYDDLDEHMQITLRQGRGQFNPLGPLFRNMRARELMLFPVSDSARLAGGVIAAPVGNRQFGLEDVNLMKSMAHAAAQALVRNTLTTVMSEKSGRLEAIMRSIYEGIFFVDETNHVAFFNPQFTELTGIAPGDVLNEEAHVLLEALCSKAQNPQHIRHELRQAIEVLSNDDEDTENYIIVEARLGDPPRELHIEFSRIVSTLNNEYLGWVAILRDNSRFRHMFNGQMKLLDVMSAQIRVPHAELRGLVTTLLGSHSRFSNREQARFLRQIERSVERMGELWENFLDMYHLEVTGLVLERSESDLLEIVQNVIDSRLFNDYRPYIHWGDSPSRLPRVRVDEIRIERVISNVLHNAFIYSPKGAHVRLTLADHGSEVHIIIQDQGAGIPPEKLSSVFDPLPNSECTNDDPVGVGLYISRELVERHNGRIWAESTVGQGTTVTIALPAIEGSSVSSTIENDEFTRTISLPQAPVQGSTSQQSVRPPGHRVQKRQPKTIMIVHGESKLVNNLRSWLIEEGYEIFDYDSGENALAEVNATRLDMIVLDVNLPDMNSLELCERMRKRTEVPIVMLADEASEAEEVRALEQYGADLFITQATTQKQRIARMNVILKRGMDIHVRTLEPLVIDNHLYIDLARREVFLDNKPVELTRIEYDLLHTLAINENQVLTHKQLLDKVWGPEYQAETQYLWVNVSRLRKKLEPTSDSPRYIHTQQGVGYVFRRP